MKYTLSTDSLEITVPPLKSFNVLNQGKYLQHRQMHLVYRHFLLTATSQKRKECLKEDTHRKLYY